jgi:conjugal transfer mating pair stabilization protein TraG
VKVGGKAGGTRTWTDSDIGIASEDRSKIFGSLSQTAESRNWNSVRDGFLRTVSTSTNSRVRSTAMGLNASLTETKTSTLEARRSEETGNRLEQQASFYAGSNAAGNLNLSQAYREWGMAEIENNRDYYGDVRFDDTTFQLSPKGQALQRKFVESYAGSIKAEVENELVLPPVTPIGNPTVSSLASVRASAQLGSIPAPGALPQGPDPSAIHDEVTRQQGLGHQRVVGQRSNLQRVTDPAKGASAESADDVKEW